MNYLINVTEIYRADTEEEAEELINTAKVNSLYSLKKSSSEHKTRKQKGEIIDEWYRVTLVKCFTDEKEPEDSTEISYKLKGGFYD